MKLLIDAFKSSLSPFYLIFRFFSSDRNEIVSDRGLEVLSDPEKMKIVNKRIKEYDDNGETGPIVVSFK